MQTMATYAASVAALQPIVVPVFDALQAGLDAATEHHAHAGFARHRDPWYFAHTVRRVAAERLRNLGVLAEAEDADRPYLALSGLLIFHRDRAVRVLRSQETRTGEIEVPVPGRSAARQRFWHQEPALDGMDTDNLLLLWRDDDGVLVEPLTLVRPVGGDHRRDSLALSWRGTLSREMAAMRAADLDELQPDAAWGRLGGEDL